MVRKGWTLIELMIVVVVIGILATMALPQYAKATERAKGGKARSNMLLISAAERQYHDTPVNEGGGGGAYIAVAAGAAQAALGRFTELQAVDSDPDWSYAVALVGGGGFTITAGRTNGQYAGKTVTLDAEGTWGPGGAAGFFSSL